MLSNYLRTHKPSNHHQRRQYRLDFPVLFRQLHFYLGSMDVRPSLSLFNLPRELRNGIYHHIFTADPYLRVTIPGGIDGCDVYTHYGRRCCKIAFPDSFVTSPTWLLTCKTLMNEALEQYSLHASWVYDIDHDFRARSPPDWRSGKLPLDQTKFRCMDVDVQHVLDWTNPGMTPSEDPRSFVWILTQYLQEGKTYPETVRFQGYTHQVELLGTEENPLDRYVQAFKEMRDHFEGLRVQNWFLEIASMHNMWKTELVFELIDDEMVLVSKDVDGKRVHTEQCKYYDRLREALDERWLSRGLSQGEGDTAQSDSIGISAQEECNVDQRSSTTVSTPERRSRYKNAIRKPLLGFGHVLIRVHNAFRKK